MSQGIFDQLLFGLENFIVKSGIRTKVISGHTFTEDLHIKVGSLSPENIHIEFQNCIFERELTIQEVSKPNHSLKFDGCTFFIFLIKRTELRNLHVASSAITHLKIIDSNIKKNFCGLRNTKEFDAILKEHVGYAKMYLKIVEPDKYFTPLTDLEVARELSIYRPSINLSDLGDSEVIFRGVNSPIFYSFGLAAINKPLPSIRVEHIRCKELNLSGTNSSSIISFYKIQVHHLVCKFLFNQSSLSFTKVEALSDLIGLAGHPSVFSINDSDLGKTSFLGCSFSSYYKLPFHSSQLSLLSLANNSWPTNATPFKLGTSDHSLLREVFRQLKHANSTQGDSLLEKHFYRLEMDELSQIEYCNKHYQNWWYFL
ncbi:MAG: hypothetical protein SH856_04385 [Flavobacteriales bacterium]|nr:hypothetical protein [Flavobacteriales bacterium]